MKNEGGNRYLKVWKKTWQMEGDLLALIEKANSEPYKTIISAIQNYGGIQAKIKGIDQVIDDAFANETYCFDPQRIEDDFALFDEGMELVENKYTKDNIHYTGIEFYLDARNLNLDRFYSLWLMQSIMRAD